MQKNVSVYIGHRGGWQDDVLTEICRQFCITESEFFRQLFLQRLARWNLYDELTNEPLSANIERFKQRRVVARLPESLDQKEEPTDESEHLAKSHCRRAKGAI